MIATKPSRRDYLFVGAQLLLFLAFLLTIDARAPSLVWPDLVGLFLLVAGGLLILVAILQLRTTLSPFPTPVAGGRLVTGGVFSVARHPIYAGILIMGLGYFLYSLSGLHMVLTVYHWPCSSTSNLPTKKNS